eukprot:7387427-Prymnesium_polylepis.2
MRSFANACDRATACVSCELPAALRCLGGGRMEHRPARQLLNIYGYSQQFGQGDHAKAMELCRAHLGEDYSITTSNEGY